MQDCIGYLVDCYWGTRLPQVFNKDPSSLTNPTPTQHSNSQDSDDGSRPDT